MWEYIEGCYAQPPEEASSGSYIIIDEFNLKRDPIKFCRDSCQPSTSFFDIQNNSTAHYCHCIANSYPYGGFLAEQDCSLSKCTELQDPLVDNCFIDDGYRRTKLYRSWHTSCPALEPDFKTNFVYVWKHHGSWHWGSKATLRCIPGYELPDILPPDGEFDVGTRTQNILCQFDDQTGGKWSPIVPCQPVRCRSPPPEQPPGALMEVVKSLEPESNQQAETILKYSCVNRNWAFAYPTDGTLPSYFFTKNIDNITISCSYSGYWEYDFGIDGSTCVGQQPDGSCESIVIPHCEDRSVECEPLSLPDGAIKEIIRQPNIENEIEFQTEIQFTCQGSQHYFNYSVPDDFTSFYYTNNIDTITLKCNEFKYWTVQNGIDGETCSNKFPESEDLHCEFVNIPACSDRAILCSDPPMPAKSKIDFIIRPDPERFEHNTRVQYTCPDRNHFFDYEVGDEFISYFYTENVNAINITCNHNGEWEVYGGLEGLTCPESNNSTSDILRCSIVNIPDCEDRTIYCSFPPDEIPGGVVNIVKNTSPFYKKNQECRWTKWFNSGKGSKGDQELVSELYKRETWQVCPFPDDIKVRISSTKQLVYPDGPQKYAKFDSVTGFECIDLQQLEGACYDYEVQLCCPYAPENGTEISLNCNVPDWFLDFNAPFISEMKATCTQNSTWTSEVSSETFCQDGSNECQLPLMPNCQDRTILCLGDLPMPDDMIQTNTTSNLTLHGFSLDASYEYKCKNEDFVIEMANYPEAVIVSCVEPPGYPDNWYYGIWKDGVWSHKENVTKCIDPNRCYSPPPEIPSDYTVAYNQTLEAPDNVNVTLNYTCAKKCNFT